MTRLVPEVTRIPRNSLRMPSTGTLEAVERGYGNPCVTSSRYSLESGLVLRRVHCETAPEQQIVRWTLSRVDITAARRVALFAVLIREMKTSPAFGRSFLIPAGIDVSRSSVLFGAPHGAIRDAFKIHYALRGVLTEQVSGMLYLDDELAPKKRFLLALFQGLKGAGYATCATEADRTALEKLMADTSADGPHASPSEVAEMFDQIRCSAP